MMELRKYILLLAYLTTISGFSISDKDHSRGRKLFGGYRIVPKVCQPTNPSRLNTNQPSICMFNYECGQRNGEVVGACMDGFLFGACCQLPSTYQTIDLLQEQYNHPKITITERPDIDTTQTQTQTAKTEFSAPSELQNPDLFIPEFVEHSGNVNDLQEKETYLLNPVTTFLRPDQILQISDPVDQLPGLFSQGLGNSNFSGTDTILLDKNGTIVDNKINPDSLFRPENRSTLFPNFSDSTEGSTTRMQPWHYMNTNRIIDATTMSSIADLVRVPTINYESPMGIKKDDDNEFKQAEMSINHILSILNSSTPNKPESPTHVTQEVNLNNSPSSVQAWVTIEDTSAPSISKMTYPYTYYKPITKPTNYYHYNYGGSTSAFASSVKTRPTRPSNLVFSSDYTPKYPSSGSSSSSPSSSYFLSTKPTTLPPAPTVIVLGPLGTSDFTTVTTPKPALRKPATTTTVVKPSVLIKKPPQTTITHNISTVISTDSSADTSATSNIISTSFINVKLKETSTLKPEELQSADIVTKKPSTVWTTLSSWSNKPSFQLRPGQSDFVWAEENLTPVHTISLSTSMKPLDFLSTENIDDDGTAAPDDISNFPPDRNPNLTNSTPISQAEKPTIVETGYPVIDVISENDIPTPSFMEDDVFTNKVDDFVNKIVDSLQDNFQDLKDIVYNRKNITTPAALVTAAPTRKPTTVNRPTQKPSGTRRPPTRKPSSSPKPGITLSTSSRPLKVTRLPVKLSSNSTEIAGIITKRPLVSTTSQTSSKKPKPTKKVTTTVTPSSTTVTISSSSTQSHTTKASVIVSTETSTTPDFRRECGVRPLVKKGRVVGGKGATFGEWPWQVLVREATWLGLFTKNKCGGVLITEKYVITAAHCQPGFLASLVAVFGEFDISGELEPRRSVSRNVRRVIVHRAYNPATFENDLAILELESPIEFDAHIVPICMPEDGIDFTGRMATVTGWGRVKYNGGVPSVLQEVQVPIMENSVCQEMFRTAGHSKLILNSFLCAGYANGQKDSCEGDSGGPLMMQQPDGRWFLVGTVSHGIKCAAPYLPGVYMRTSYFKPWLESVTDVGERRP